MAARRLCLALITLLVWAALCRGLHAVLAPGGWTAPKLLMMVSFFVALPWVGYCAAHGLVGFVLLLAKHRGAPEPLPDGPLPRTAISVTVRNEDMDAVLPPLRRLLAALDAIGAGDAFALFVLSDTADPDAASDEEAAVAAFRVRDRDPGRIHYRRRRSNEGFKAGNVMEFLDHHAAGFELMLVLDADSQMSARAVLRLVRTMRDAPHLAIVQHLTIGL